MVGMQLRRAAIVVVSRAFATAMVAAIKKHVKTPAADIEESHSGPLQFCSDLASRREVVTFVAEELIGRRTLTREVLAGSRRSPAGTAFGTPVEVRREIAVFIIA